ncbi:hypothetical protein HMPREF1475_02334 [Hoylesella oralis HGA0225]|nr:hypothetical protein HMPREF1475_02334 [Hoylesella oralis HGA0225]SHG08909.1 hypothetical protein SAMN05444288_2337 [Hoylesella oralis]
MSIGRIYIVRFVYGISRFLWTSFFKEPTGNLTSFAFVS